MPGSPNSEGELPINDLIRVVFNNSRNRLIADCGNAAAGIVENESIFYEPQKVGIRAGNEGRPESEILRGRFSAAHRAGHFFRPFS